MDFSKDWKNSDQILVTEERELHVHRCVLSLWSPVFDRMFNSDFIEKTSKRISLPDKKYEEIVEMLEVVYDRRKEITAHNFDFLLALADEFQMDQLRDECVKYIKLADKTGMRALKYMNIIKRFDIKDLDKDCLKELEKLPNKELFQCEAYQVLDDNTKLAIITKRSNYLESVLTKYKQCVAPFVEYLYNRANDGYVAYLHEQGLQEGIFTKCDRREKHVNKKLGQNFDYDCESCRERMKSGKQFTLNTKEVSDMLEKLYLCQLNDVKLLQKPRDQMHDVKKER